MILLVTLQDFLPMIDLVWTDDKNIKSIHMFLRK